MAWTNLTKNTASYSNATKNTSSANFVLLLEDGVSFPLLEDGGRILLEQTATGWATLDKKETTFTNLTKN